MDLRWEINEKRVIPNNDISIRTFDCSQGIVFHSEKWEPILPGSYEEDLLIRGWKLMIEMLLGH